MMEEEERGKSRDQDKGGMEASSPTGSTTDEETDEDSESEPPPVIRRKVSFADAFGLNLVSVKEFDSAEATELEVSQAAEKEATHSAEEFYMCCLFTVPSSPEELEQRLQAQMMELESIELLPGTTSLRGIIRVVNLCYSKSVFARITLDRWNSCFDLPAEYVPGSSDRKTDRFTFKYTLVPPFERGGTRVEFCLCYESSAGTFWANNKELNYVLFCHQKEQMKEHGPQVQEESYKSKRSCLKANRNGSTTGKTRETVNTATVAAEIAVTQRAEKAHSRTLDSEEVQSLLHSEEHKPLVESVKSRRKAARLARVQDFLSQRTQQNSKDLAHDSANGQKDSQPMPAPWGDSASLLYKYQKAQPNDCPQVLTYHQIPLLTLDWSNDKPQEWETADVDDIWSGRAKMTLSKEENAPSADDMWETFLNGTDDTDDKEASVCDVWQAFLNGPNHSDVPESEWLQAAASVSPSNDKRPQPQYSAYSQEFGEFQLATDTPTPVRAHTLAARQPLSHTWEELLPDVASNAEDHQPAEACVTSLRDDNTATQDTSQRSQTSSVTDTPQKFSLEGAPPVSEDSIDSSTECHKHVVRERETEGIIGGAKGVEEEPITSHTADLITSSGESETTDMTAMPEFQNASAVDSISQGARLDEGLSSSKEGEVTGTAHNAIDDMLAFRETIRQGTKDGARYASSTFRKGVKEEDIMMNYTENKASAEEEIFRPQGTEKSEISPRYGDETQCEKFGLNRNSGNLQESDKNETRPQHLQAGGFDSKQENKIVAVELNEDVPLKTKDVTVLKTTEEETSFSTTSKETKELISTEVERFQAISEPARQHNDKALDLNSSQRKRNTSIILDVHDKQSQPIQVGEEPNFQLDSQTEQSGLKAEAGEHGLNINVTEVGKHSSCDGIIANPSVQTRPTEKSSEMNQAFQSDCDTFRPSPANKCTPKPSEVVGVRWTDSQEDTKDRNENVCGEMRQEEIKAKENVAKKDTSTEHQSATLQRLEGDMSQEDSDEMMSTGELKMEAVRELMGNVESPRGERKNAPAELKEEELSAEVESSPCVEYKKLSDGTKEPITGENNASLEVIEVGLEEIFIERFVEDLVRGIWEEVFGREVQASNRHTDIVDGMGCRLRGTTQDCHLLFDKDLNDTFDSGVFSLTELPTESNSSLCQGPEQTLHTNGDERSLPERSKSLSTAEQTHFLSESQTDLSRSANLSHDLTATLAARSWQSLPETTQTPKEAPTDQESHCHIKDETGRQTEDCIIAHRESFNQSAHPSHKHPSSSSEKLKEADGLVWWSILYILSHVTRLLICVLLIGGFFVIVFLYDFPAVFALYIVSLSWWFYKWKRHQVTTEKGMVG